MTTYFLDAGALAKRYLHETGSSWIVQLIAPDSLHVINKYNCKYVVWRKFLNLRAGIHTRKPALQKQAHCGASFLTCEPESIPGNLRYKSKPIVAQVKKLMLHHLESVSGNAIYNMD